MKTTTRNGGNLQTGFFAGAIQTDASHGVFNEFVFNLTTYGNRSSPDVASLKPVNRCYVPRCKAGTRGYIFKEMDKWLEDVDEPNVLWVCGSPGAGKSAIAASMVSTLMDRGQLGSAFFFRRGDVTLSDPAALWRTVAYDLATYDDAFAGAMVKSLKTRKLPLGWPDIESHFKYLIREALMNTYGSSKPPIIVIDALDECGFDSSQEMQRRDLLDTLLEWSRLPKSFKLIVTGRDDRIPASFRTSCKQILLPTGSIVTAEANKDIRSFFKDRFSELPSSKFDGWPGERILDNLTARAAGLFLWADTIMRLLKQGLPDEQLEKILNGDLGTGDNLTKLYQQLLEFSFQDVDGRTLEMYKTVVSAVILARIPFNFDDLPRFLSQEKRSVQYILGVLSSVIFVGNTDNRIRIGHLSFGEFLCDPNRCPEQFLIDRGKESQRLAMGCFQQMKERLEFNICGLETSYLLNKDVKNLPEQIEKKIPGLLSYSCRFWGVHLRDTESNQEGHKALLKEVKDFLDCRLLFWLEVMSLIEKVLSANRALLTAIPWIEKFDTHLSAFAEDASRFIVNFEIPISASVPHIYLSALPFSPSESLVVQQYERQFPNTISVVSGRDRTWPAVINICQGHTEEVNSVAMSFDGKQIVSGSDDKTIRIWDVETGQLAVGPFEGHSGYVTSVAFSSDGRRVVSGSWDNTVRIWDVKTGEVSTDPSHCHGDHVNSVVFSPDGTLAVSGSSDNTIRIWDGKTGRLEGGPFKGHTMRVNSVAISHDGRRVASGSDDKTVRIWDINNGVLAAAPFKGHVDIVNSVAFSSDGWTVVSGSCDGTVRIWNLNINSQVTVGSFTEDPIDAITSVAFSPNDKQVVLGSRDNAIRIWDVEKDQVIAGPFEGHTDWVSSVAFSSDGKMVVSGSYDKTVRVWDAGTVQIAVVPFKARKHAVSFAAFSLDNTRVVSGSSDNTIRIWDVEKGHLNAVSFEEKPHDTTSVASTPRREHIILDDEICQLGFPEGHAEHLISIAFSSDGKHVISGSTKQTVRNWDIETGQVTTVSLKDCSGSITSIASSPDGKLIVSGLYDNTIRIWDVATGQVAAGPFVGHEDHVRSVAFSPSGSILSQACCVAAGPLKGHTSVVAFVAFSSDGKRIVSGSFDNTVRIWNFESNEATPVTFEGHTSWVRTVAFSRDGKRVISGSDDKTIRIWNVETDRGDVSPFHGHTHHVTSVAFSADGKRAISGSCDQTIRVWDIDTCKASHGSDPIAVSTSSARALSRIYGPNSYVDDLEMGWLRGPVRDKDGGSDSDDQDVDNELIKHARLLFWVPQSSRKGLCGYETLAILGARVTKLDLSRFVHGKSWTQCLSSPTNTHCRSPTPVQPSSSAVPLPPSPQIVTCTSSSSVGKLPVDGHCDSSPSVIISGASGKKGGESDLPQSSYIFQLCVVASLLLSLVTIYYLYASAR